MLPGPYFSYSLPLKSAVAYSYFQNVDSYHLIPKYLDVSLWNAYKQSL